MFHIDKSTLSAHGGRDSHSDSSGCCPRTSQSFRPLLSYAKGRDGFEKRCAHDSGCQTYIVTTADIPTSNSSRSWILESPILAMMVLDVNRNVTVSSILDLCAFPLYPTVSHISHSYSAVANTRNNLIFRGRRHIQEHDQVMTIILILVRGLMNCHGRRGHSIDNSDHFNITQLSLTEKSGGCRLPWFSQTS